jgi:hypothetical protein
MGKVDVNARDSRGSPLHAAAGEALLKKAFERV